MAKKGNRVQVILECTEHKASGQPGTSRYVTTKNKKNTPGLAYYEENKDKLKLVGVDNGSGVVMPSLETVGNGTYAPLSRPIFIYVSSLAVQKEEVKEFVSFYLESASSLVSEVGYIPLPDTEYAKEIEKFNAFIK